MQIEKNAPALKIAVFSDGRLTVDGAPASIQSLRQSLRKIADEHGVVLYYREAADKAPPPIATEVINQVMEARVPIRLSARPDYSDAVTAP